MNAKPQNTARHFAAPTIFEAYTKLKREMGDEAVILRTRTFKKGGILGLWGHKMVEITAADAIGQPRAKKPQASLAVPLLERTYRGAGERPRLAVAPVAPTPAPSPSGDAVYHNFKAEISEIRQMIEQIQDSGRYRHWPGMPPEFEKAFQKLQSHNIHEDIARALIQRWLSHYPDYQKGMRVEVGLLEKYVGEMVVPAGPIHIKGNGSPTVVMLVGPTGVGKTTTLAKLAARYKLKEELSVALITIDTYRIAAVEQLKVYSELINVPLKVVSTPADMAGALKLYQDHDLILIDTAGRSPRNQERMEDLRRFVEAAHPDEVHLVMSINIHNDVMRDTLERFAAFPVHKLLLTKLDEAAHYGIVLTILSKAQKPIGYLTTGQAVPEDIELVNPKRLARLILGLDRIQPHE